MKTGKRQKKADSFRDDYLCQGTDCNGQILTSWNIEHERLSPAEGSKS